MTLLIASFLALAAPQQLVVPASTAYIDPDPSGARVSREGITDWTDPDLSVSWFGHVKRTGALRVSVVLTLPRGAVSRLELTVAGVAGQPATTAPAATSSAATASAVTASTTTTSSTVAAIAEGRADRQRTGREGEDPSAGSGEVAGEVRVDFGTLDITAPGYHSFVLRSRNDKGVPAGGIRALVLEGEPIDGAHFNLDARRNAASVHLFYPVDKVHGRVSAFYCEMTGVEDPLWTYYMACGWHRGYFGMQVNSATERRIIFSVWDSGGEAVDRDKVAAEDRVTLVDKGEGVFSGSFGNEGTGGHSHLKFQWKTGQPQRFLVTAEPVAAAHTIFSGYYYRPDTASWMLISSWKAPEKDGYLRGLYSFSENFSGRNGHVVRRARYGNQWIRNAAGTWVELTTATFSHDGTGKTNRLDRFGGVEGDCFFLSHGGFVEGFTPYGERFERPVSGRSPVATKLPPLPLEHD